MILCQIEMELAQKEKGQELEEALEIVVIQKKVAQIVLEKVA